MAKIEVLVSDSRCGLAHGKPCVMLQAERGGEAVCESRLCNQTLTADEFQMCRKHIVETRQELGRRLREYISEHGARHDDEYVVGLVYEYNKYLRKDADSNRWGAGQENQ